MKFKTENPKCWFDSLYTLLGKHLQENITLQLSLVAGWWILHIYFAGVTKAAHNKIDQIL